MHDTPVAIQLTVPEVNYLLSTLAEQPFKTVSGLIVKIKSQADAEVARLSAGPQLVEDTHQ